jgi:glycylpeptide N-tetradecanoyltransferase
MTLARTLRLYRLDDQPKTPGFRKMTLADCPSAFKILKEVGNFDFYQENRK